MMLETQLKLGLNDQGRLLTDEEFAGAEYDAPYRYERVEGRLVVMSPSGKTHLGLVWAILKHLSLYDATHPGIIEMAAPEAWIRTREGRDRMADIGVYFTEDEPQSDRQYERIPRVVFEVVSKGSEERDYIVKRYEYFEHGIWEYVIVDPFRKVVTVLSSGERDYRARELRDGDVYTSDQLPGFELSITDLPW